MLLATVLQISNRAFPFKVDVIIENSRNPDGEFRTICSVMVVLSKLVSI